MTKHCEDLRRVRNTSERHFLNWQHREREAGSPGREERVKSFPLQYKRKECAERLGFLLLQWELQKHREEAEEKKGGVSPLKTCRDWERKRERESGTENQRERGRTSLSVCLWKEYISASQWFALGERHQLASDPKGRPDQVTPVKTKWALPLPLPPLSLYPGMSRRKQRKPQQLISDCEGPSASENGGCLRRGGGALNPSLCGSGQGKGRAPGPWAKARGGHGHWGFEGVEMQGVRRWPGLGRSPAWLFSGLILFVFSVLFFSGWNGVFKLALSPHPRVFSPGPPLLTGLCAVAK